MKIFGAVEETAAAVVESVETEVAAVVAEAAPVSEPVVEEAINAALTEAIDPAVEDVVEPVVQAELSVTDTLKLLASTLTDLVPAVESIENKTLVGKAAFRKAVVKTREELMKSSKVCKSLFHAMHGLGLSAISEIPSERVSKTPEAIAADIAKLQARLDAMTAQVA